MYCSGVVVVAPCPPDCGCSGCLRRARALERQADALFRKATGERLPSELNTARLSGDISLTREKRESLGRRILPTLDTVTQRPNVESHAYQQEAVERLEERLEERLKVDRSAGKDLRAEIKELEEQLRVVRMVRAEATGAEIAKALGCSRSRAVELKEAILKKATRSLPVIVVRCKRPGCKESKPYRMGGQRPLYCSKECRQRAYWQRQGCEKRRELRGLARRMARQKEEAAALEQEMARRMARRKGRGLQEDGG